MCFIWGAHPSNYKGCTYYHQLYKNFNNSTHHKTISNSNTMSYQKINNQILANRISYANAVKSNENSIPNSENITNNENVTSVLTKFLEDFKNMINQLIQ